MITKNSLNTISTKRTKLIHEENFVYLRPSKKLSNLISNFTITFASKDIISDDYTIMPHGSVTLVLFYYHHKCYSFLFGPTTKPIKVGNLANKCEIIFIIEFQPTGFFFIKNIKQNELTDKIIPFSLIDYELDKIMKDILNTSLTVDQLLDNIEEKLIQINQFTYPQELSDAINKIIQMEGIMTSVEISNNVCYSPRHSNRLFNQYLGMSMKSFCKLVRINKALRLINENVHSLDVISEQLGYYDVSHFIKDFKIICHLTPQEYRNKMSDFYNEIAKF